jgi:hypothetical protein
MGQRIFISKKIIIILILICMVLIVLDIFILHEKSTLAQKIRLLEKLLGS